MHTRYSTFPAGARQACRLPDPLADLSDAFVWRNEEGRGAKSLLKCFFQSSEQVRPGVQFFHEFSDFGRR